MTTPERARRLMLLHQYNAYVLSFLVLSGILLYLPGLRGVLAPARIPLKDVHIAAGLLQVGLLLAYIPLLGGHWLRLARRYGQQLNVVLLAVLVVGWVTSGIVIWLHRWLPEGWAATALTVHDWFTWIAIPWAGLHAITRFWHWRVPLPLWWVGFSRDRAFDPSEFARPKPRYAPRWQVPLTRRMALQAFGTAVAGLSLYGLWRAVGGAALGGGLGQDPGYKPPAPGHAIPVDQPNSAGARQSGFVDVDGEVPPVPEDGPETAQGQPVLSAADRPTPSSPLPSGGGRDGRFRLYTVTDAVPAFKPDTWQLTVSGLVERPLTYSWRQFIALPRTVLVRDFHCVTGWKVKHITWEGVMLSDLLRKAGVRPEGKFVKFISGDGVYTDALPLTVALKEDVMVPFLIDNAIIPTPMGGPVRLVVPKMYGYKSVKWLQGIEVIPENHEGFWEVRGYPNDALLPEFGGTYVD